MFAGLEMTLAELTDEEQHLAPPCPLEPFHHQPCACLDPSILPPGVSNECSAIHHWFGLSCCSYLVLARSILQSMSQEWQARFVGLLQELDDATSEIEQPVDHFDVKACDVFGNKMVDPYAFYDRGRRVVPLKES